METHEPEQSANCNRESGCVQRMVGHRELEPRSNEASDAAGGGGVGVPWWTNEDDGQNYGCELCHDTGRVDAEDGHYQYLGDGTISCPRCCGVVVVGGRDDASERNGAQVPNDLSSPTREETHGR